MKIRINAAIHQRDDELSTNRLEDGQIVGHLVAKIIPPMTPVDLPDDEALRLLAAFPGWEVGKETQEDLDWLEQLEKQPRVPRQAPTRPAGQTPVRA